MDHREENEETGVWELGLPTIVGGNGVSRLRWDQEIRHEEAEHGRAVYCDTANSVPL